MSNRTWVCLTCRKSYRRSQSVTALPCPRCHRPCEFVHWKIRIPSPRRAAVWDAFWAKYLAEKAQLDAHFAGQTREVVQLQLLNTVLSPRS